MQKLIDIIKKDGAESCLLLAPRQIAIKRILRELAKEQGVVLGLKSLTIPGLITHLSHGIGNLPTLISDVVAGEIINVLSKRIRSNNQSGLVRLLSKRRARTAILNTIRDLKIAGITARELKSIGNDNLNLLGKLIDEFDFFCAENNVLERVSWQTKIIQHIEQHGDNLVTVKHVFVTGFNSLPPHYQELISALGKSRSIHLHLPYDEDREELFSDNTSFVTSLNVDRMESTYDPCNCTGALQDVHGKLFGSDFRPVDRKADNISFHTAPGRFDEIEAVLMRIIALIHDDGVQPSEIGLSMRDLSQYDQFIRTLFKRHDIPYTYRRGTPMIHSPAIRLAMKLTEIGSEELRYDRLLSIIRSKFMSFDEAHSWQECILKSMTFSETPEKWPDQIRNIAATQTEKESTPIEEELIEQAAKGIKSFLDQCIATGESEQPLVDLTKLCAQHIEKKLRKTNDPFVDPFQRDFDHFLEVLKKLQTDIELLSEKMKISVSGNLQLDLLRDLVSSTPLREYQDPEDAVAVLNFFDMGYQKVDHLFIVGMDDHSVPRPPHNSSSLLSEPDVEALLSEGIGNAQQLSTTARRRIREEQAFFLATGSATKSLRLYCPQIDKEGKEITPSPYFVELQRLSSVMELEKEPGGDQRELVSTPPDAHAIRRQFARHMYRTDLSKRDEKAIPLYNQLLNDNEDNKRFIKRLDTIREIETVRFKSIIAQVASPWTGKIENSILKKNIEDTFGDPQQDWSQSALQAYGTCPFEFFLKYVLRLQEFKQPKEDGDPRKTGLLYHRILKDFVDSMQSAYPLNDFDSAWNNMLEIIHSTFKEQYGSDNALELSIPTRILLRKTIDIMRRFVLHEIRYPFGKPLHTEFQFDGNSSAFDIRGRRIGLEGYIDRIDQVIDSDPARYIVIDYKSGSSDSYKPKPDTIREKLNLQLPHYILAAAQSMKAETDNVSGKFLLLGDLSKKAHLDPTSDKWRTLFAEPGNEGVNDTEQPTIKELFLEIIEGIARAEFPVSGTVHDEINMVARKFEKPPEMAESEE